MFEHEQINEHILYEYEQIIPCHKYFVYIKTLIKHNLDLSSSVFCFILWNY